MARWHETPRPLQADKRAWGTAGVRLTTMRLILPRCPPNPQIYPYEMLMVTNRGANQVASRCGSDEAGGMQGQFAGWVRGFLLGRTTSWSLGPAPPVPPPLNCPRVSPHRGTCQQKTSLGSSPCLLKSLASWLCGSGTSSRKRPLSSDGPHLLHD